MRKRLLSLGLIMVLCFSLTGCKSSDYKKAVELQNSGDYAGALELFKGIGDDYKDVSDRATECQSFIDSITAFDEAKSLLDDKNAELDKAISEANDLVNGENTALDESLRSLLETKISETKAIKITAPTMAETVKEIDTQTTEMNTTDYSDALKSLNEAYTAFNNSVKQYELVNNPAESYVIKCLEKVEHVIGMAASSVEIFNAYLPQIKDLYLPIKNEAEYGKEFDDAHNIRYINITKWVTDKKENNLEKLVNVYAVLSNEDCNIALVFERKQNKTNVYLAIVNNKNSTSSTDADNYKDQIVEAIRGNFPGAEWKDSGLGVLPCFKDDKNYSVATASNIPTEKSEKFISQTIEKLIDGIIPDTNKKEYTIILLATPILDAVEKSYVDCGWDIVKSENKYGEELYPSFADVARNVKEIIDSSEYDAENKGAYKGSLLTRLQSLCNGINGMIFVADEIPKEQLFEENVIVDLSRVGSSETKSLIMGMMVLKLQEYRMSSATGMNAELNHITVLEEAHNLLRRTSNEQSAEGSNLLGKSVEMLSNAIAEMRTYGEGFIIADQAPGLMDMSVIRNTNTKIILRLPDQADRELVGRAANLNEDQITELAKLPCGVAAVYQNEWIQPVLCKVDLFAAPEKPFMFDPDDNDLDNYCKTEVEESLLNCIMEKEILRRGNKTDLKALKSKIIKSKLETCVKRDFMEYLEHDGENAIETLRKLIYDFLSAENAIIEAKQCNDIVEWTRTVVDRLNPSLRAYPNKQIDLALALILYEQTLRDASYGSVFCKFTEVYKNEGGVF